MNDPVMWNGSLLIINMLALAGLVSLFWRAPCWMQKLVVGLLAVGCVFIAGSFMWALFDAENHWRVRQVGYALEHIAVLLYVFRLIFQDALQWKSSPQSHSSAH